MNDKVNQEAGDDVGHAAPVGGKVYPHPRQSEWRRRNARRQSPLARVKKVKEPVTRLRRRVPRPDARTPSPPAAVARPQTDEARFYLVVRPYGTPWDIGRIPATEDCELDKRAIDEALDRGWLVISERSRAGSEMILNPIRFRGAMSTRDMKCKAKMHCNVLAAVLYDGADDTGDAASTIGKKLDAATVLTVDNVLELD